MAPRWGELICVRCGDSYRKHRRGHECRAVDEDGRCPCLGFLWVDPRPPAGEDLGYPRGAVPAPGSRRG